jgi:hypothetical protein
MLGVASVGTIRTPQLGYGNETAEAICSHDKADEECVESAATTNEAGMLSWKVKVVRPPIKKAVVKQNATAN